jgi:hypothetical protein
MNSAPPELGLLHDSGASASLTHCSKISIAQAVPSESVKTYLKRALLLTVGWGFVLLGIIGLFLPVLQGVLFLLVGLTILSTQYAWAHRWMTKLRLRFPKISDAADRTVARATRWWRHASGSPPSH